MSTAHARYDTVVVCGATASGKTRLGVAVARHIDGEILSVDSRQVYRGMDVGTGKDLQEYGEGAERVPVHLLDIADPAQVYTLWQFQSDFYAAWRGVCARAHVPVAVGGSGLYLEAALKNYRLANVPEDEQLRLELMTRSKPALEMHLRDTDPALHACTDCSSKKRIVRAIEIARAQRRSSTQWGHAHMPDIRPFVVGVRWERLVLHERIRTRLEQRLAGGMLEEVRGLLSRGVPAARLEQIGLEYRWLGRHIRGELGFHEMREELFRAICRFAKRQDTWFRGMERRGTPIHWIAGDDVSAALAAVDAALASA